MKDPFFFARVPWLSRQVQPWADYLDLPTLPLHIHEVVGAALFYSLCFYPFSPWISNLLAPKHYPNLSHKRRLNWDAHVVSMVQSIIIVSLSAWVMIVDTERNDMDREQRIWGYTGAAGLIQALAAGYFLWDAIVTGLNFDVFGFGTLAHAVSALVAYSLGFRPFVNYYSSTFILWEISTPFLNVHWFMDKVNMTGTRAQLYNGLVLLSTFFSCRLIYGTYSSLCVLSDIWAKLNANPDPKGLASSVMAFATIDSTVSNWLGAAYLVSNSTLNALNFYWFYMMVKAVRKRFQPAKVEVPAKAAITEAEVDLTTVSSAAAKASKPRRRRA
ncbi:hypothetical protein G7046_g10047 [Stylonectria norvegica]|nr:hypothetical protein G7046_g10047 [Stylonectria norvegica]